MKGSQTFSEILKARMKTPVSEGNASSFLEESQTLWVQILPFVSREKWVFPETSKYPRRPHKEKTASTPSQPEILRPAASPPPVFEMKIHDLKLEDFTRWELLVRKGWIPRKDHYTLTEWKQAHRKAVRKLHPDTRSEASSQSFSEVHEGFKALKSYFKAPSSTDAVYDTECA